MLPFFVVIGSCGFFSCSPPQTFEFETANACVEYAQTFARHSDMAATCFDRKTGSILWDYKGRR